MSMADPVAIDVETPRVNSRYSLEKEFTKLIYMNPLMVLYKTFNQVDLGYGYVCGLCRWMTVFWFWLTNLLSRDLQNVIHIRYNMKSLKMIV